jgi:hypothetical protein
MSSINPNNINGQYPVAGQDNDSQGFRDNFTNIINNFTFAYNEINDLQQNALLKNPLSGTALSNDMNYAQLVKPKLLNVVHTQNSLGEKSGSFNVSWLDGDFQKFTAKGSGAAGADDCTLSFTNWPSNGTYAKIRLQITTSANVANLTFPTTVSNVGIQSIQGWSSGQTIKLEGSNVYQFEVASNTNGDLLTVQDLLRNYNIETTGVTGNFATVTASTALNATADTASTSNATGALKVSGGAGIVGNINAGALTTPGGQFHTLIGNLSISNSISGGYLNVGGNVLAAGISAASAILGTATINGNLSSTAAHVETGYQQVKPGANVAVTVNTTVNRVLLHPASTIISFGANVTLPNVQVDGTIVNISSNVTIAQLDVRPNWNGVVTVSPFGNTTITAGSNTRYMYIAADKVWYKIA